MHENHNIKIMKFKEIHVNQRNLSEIKEILKSVVKSTEITKSQLKSGDFEIAYTFFRVSDPSVVPLYHSRIFIVPVGQVTLHENVYSAGYVFYECSSASHRLS